MANRSRQKPLVLGKMQWWAPWVAVRVGDGVPWTKKNWKMEVWHLSQELITQRKWDDRGTFLWHLYQRLRPQLIAYKAVDPVILAEVAPMFEQHSPVTDTILTIFDLEARHVQYHA